MSFLLVITYIAAGALLGFVVGYLVAKDHTL